MKKQLLLTLSILIGGSILSSCGGNSSTTIKICASELPHAKILNEAIKPLIEEKGYTLEVRVLDWTIQNSSVAAKDYDANYFQHIPYLDTYNSEVSEEYQLEAACKVHYEKLCLYASNKNEKTIKNNSRIILVDDPSNAERALKLLEENNILTINDSNYVDGAFKNFNIENPNSCVTFLEGYENISLTCIPESNLCVSLPDYDFGIIPGNTMLTGYSDLNERIVFGEDASEDLISEKANIIAVRKNDINSEKTLALVEAFNDTRVETYISTTFGESVLYHYEDLTK